MELRIEKWKCDKCGLTCSIEIETSDEKMPADIAHQSRFVLGPPHCPCKRDVPRWERVDDILPNEDRIAELELHNKLLQDRLEAIQSSAGQQCRTPTRKKATGQAPTPITF